VSRVSPGTLIVGIFALLFGLAGAFAVREYLRPAPVEPEVVVEVPRIIPLASIDLEPGRPLTISDVMLVSMTDEQLRDRELPAEYMTNPQQIVGRILREGMQKGEAFATTRFYPEGMGPPLSDRLRPGLRAVTIALEDSGTGLTTPGSYVDVLFRANSDDGRPETTVTLISGIEVLALDGNSVPGTRVINAESATLAVTSRDARALKIAEGNGIFSLSLRNPEDEQLASSAGSSTLNELLNIPPDAQFDSEIYRRGRRQLITFQGGAVNSMEPVEIPVIQAVRQPAATPSKPVSK
jgi:Flp pilus assembly protein CpaB